MSYFLMNLFKTYGLSQKGLHLGGGQNAPKIAYILDGLPLSKKVATPIVIQIQGQILIS